MDVVVEQYLDLGIMRDEFGFVLDGFWETLQLSLVSGVLALTWGLVLALLRQLPGSGLAPVRGLDDRLHRRRSAASRCFWWC